MKNYFNKQERQDLLTLEAAIKKKKRYISKAYQEWRDQLSGNKKQCIREIPNFDAKKFGMITGINTEEIE